MKKKKKKSGLWNLADETIALGLGVDVELYIEVVETRCTDEEMDNIICPLIFGESEENQKKAEQLFYSKLTETELKEVKRKFFLK